MEAGKSPQTDYLTDVEQKIPDRLTKVTFLVRTETVIRPGIKSRFDIMGFSASDPILGLGFFSLTGGRAV